MGRFDIQRVGPGNDGGLLHLTWAVGCSVIIVGLGIYGCGSGCTNCINQGTNFVFSENRRTIAANPIIVISKIYLWHLLNDEGPELSIFQISS